MKLDVLFEQLFFVSLQINMNLEKQFSWINHDSSSGQ